MKSRALRVIGQAVAIVILGGAAAYLHASIKPISISGDTAAPGAPAGTTKIQPITLAEARALYDNGNVAFIDARDLEEYEKGHVPGAFWLPFSAFLSGKEPDVIQYLPRDLPIVLYCEGGDCHASNQVAEMLVDYGFDQLRLLTDGWPAWEAGGHPVEKGPPPTGS